MQNNDCLHVVKKWKKLKGTVADIDRYTGHSILGTKKVGVCALCKQEVSTFTPNKKSARKLALEMKSQN